MPIECLYRGVIFHKDQDIEVYSVTIQLLDNRRRVRLGVLGAVLLFLAVVSISGGVWLTYGDPVAILTVPQVVGGLALLCVGSALIPSAIVIFALRAVLPAPQLKADS